MSQIQAVLFDKNRYSTASARDWLKSHELIPIKRVHKTDRFLRYRLEVPSKYTHFITKKITNDISFIIGYF